MDLQNQPKNPKPKPNKPTLVLCYWNGAAAGKNYKKQGWCSGLLLKTAGAQYYVWQVPQAI